MAEIPDWSKKNYLVIDDFSVVHRMLRDMLRKFGAASIDTVKNGAEAMALLAERQYDVVLCDYHFSEGPNGQQILEEARHRDLVALTCIWIMVSSEKAVETVMGAAEQAPDGYILKPLAESTLLSRLNRAWDRKQAFLEIDRAYAARDFRKAIALCDQRLQTNRLHVADLLRMKAGLLVKCGEIKEARAVYELALAIRDQVWAKTGLAKLHYVTGQYSPAKFLLYEVISTNPSYLDAYDYLAQTLQKLGDVEEAQQVLENAAALSPYSVARQKNLGDLAFKLDRLSIAESAYLMSIDVGEHSVFRSPDPYLGLARVYARKKQLAQALQVLDSVRQTFDSEKVHILSKIAEAQIYLMFKQVEKARVVAQYLRSEFSPSQLQLGETARALAALYAATGLHDEPEESPPPPDLAAPLPIPTAAATPPLDQGDDLEIIKRFAIEGSGERSSAKPAGQAPANVPAASPANIWTTPAKPAVSTPRPAAPTAPTAPGAAATPAIRAVTPPTPQSDSEAASGDLPEKARSLINRANALLQYMQRQGYNAVSAEETRSVISRIEKIVPGDARVQTLHATLKGLIPS